MSVKALSAVFEESRAANSAFVVLLAMADWADHNGRCWPSLMQIARKARVSRATAAVAINELIGLGELEKVRGGHAPDRDDDEAPASVRAQRRNAYRITLVKGKPAGGGLDSGRAGGPDSGRPGNRAVSPQVVQDLDHHRDPQVVQSSAAGSPDHEAEVVQNADPHIRKNRQEEPSEEPSATTAAAAAGEVFGGYVFNPDDPCDRFAVLWNDAVDGSALKRVASLTPTRRRLIRLRLDEHALEQHQRAIGRLAASSFATGSNARGFVATFDWYIGSPDPATKALEGQYDDHFTEAELRSAADQCFRSTGRTCPHSPRCEDWRACPAVRQLALALRAKRRQAS